jgi:hypothetical protein
MKFIYHLKAGANFAPAFLLLIYYLSAALDVVTTYLVTPDFKLEANWLVVFFKLNWIQNIIFYSLVVLAVTIGLLLALDFLHNFFQESVKYSKGLFFEILSNKKLLISFIILGCFYSHLINLVPTVINNYLGYVYLFRIENAFSKVSTYYIIHQSVFLFYIHIVPILLGYIAAAFKIKRIANKYRLML